jgi:predicted membrane protein
MIQAGVVRSRARPQRVSVLTVSEIGQRIASQVFGSTKKMPLINLVIALIVVGVALYLVNRFIPMASSIKTILNVVVVVAVCVWLLQAVGLWGNVTSYRLTR